MMSIEQTVRRFFTDLDNATGDNGDAFSARPLIVGVSGGPDSVVLLHALAKEHVYPEDRIVAAHLNHMIRPNAPAEASFVASLAEAWQLTFRARAVDVKALAQQEGLSLEAAARQARYTFLADVAREFGAGHIVTGHNQNDQAETVLMHFIRGSGLSGLRAMQPVSPVPGDPDLKLLRPLLTVSREAIMAYCAANGLAYMEDESNEDVSLLRNRIRHELLPTLADYNPQIMARLDTLSKTVDADEVLLGQILEEYWSALVIEESETLLSLHLTRWRELPLSMRRRSLRRAAFSLRPDLTDFSFEATELAREVAETGQSGSQVLLPGSVKLVVDYHQLVFLTSEHLPPEAEWPQLPGDEAHRLAVPGIIALSGSWVLSVDRLQDIDFEQITRNPDPWRAYISVKFADELVVRPRQEGERLRPLGLGGRSTKVGDIMTDRKIPARARGRWPIVAGQQHALWLTGYVLDERARVQPGDEEALLVRAEGPESVD
ncbi:MAG: tRNA lysidine(34) synthetase TilS [Chloroflexota bacterium]|jgi:tRNA(Ile)-lysidine synthase